MHHFRLLPFVLALALIACDHVLPSAPDVDQTLDGPVDGLTQDEMRRFLAGDRAFNDQVFTVATGLGPVFVATSCGGCHAADGKGHPFSAVIRFGQSDTTGNPFASMGGPQLQYRAIPGFTPETLPPGAPHTTLVPPSNPGLGFLEALTDAQILAHADPSDADGDGVSGVPNYVRPRPYFIPMPHHLPVNGRYIGRLGKKAATIDLLQQTVTAYNQDIGITSTFEPIDPYTGLVNDPEVTDRSVADVVFYLQTLKAPTQRTPTDPSVMHGKDVFTAIGCATCHVPSYTTPRASVAALSEKQIFPYTDLLLHDMGPGLDDGYTEGSAQTNEWKTPALWGLGLAPASQGGRYFLLHDGRAHSIHDAIMWHGGEAARSKERYDALPAHDREDLLRFLESL
ncbi:MAG: thiol oxidoreductase [Bacteroidetes bacterium]|nr:thiol oxidoreductase [Bacteroidota bacterium]